MIAPGLSRRPAGPCVRQAQASQSLRQEVSHPPSTQRAQAHGSPLLGLAVPITTVGRLDLLQLLLQLTLCQ